MSNSTQLFKMLSSSCTVSEVKGKGESKNMMAVVRPVKTSGHNPSNHFFPGLLSLAHWLRAFIKICHGCQPRAACQWKAAQDHLLGGNTVTKLHQQ
jgi:hypothetical protein